ncbi:hypothetical protein H6G89_16860 [Oscillatoria sp. FACHB-1407]|uniref:hypothetical protein n=1 Tax=Oscillatoria sp. FACHB-1407 TaxID=2692847 RepID=UPI001681C433|nr:hypothetical protein [Oscillatoria sp. FACHB-1407]MBD2462712.1 hypothetical protein [Oscillatoria sp. FACHB-1407]
MQIRQRPLDDYRLHSIHHRSISRNRDGVALQKWLQPPTEFTSALAEAIAWIAASAAVRIVMDWLLASSTDFWIPVLIGIVTPAAIAVGLSTLMPQLSLVLGYRLILVMIGLLLGGKL